MQLGETIIIVAAVAATKPSPARIFSRSPWITAKSRRSGPFPPVATSSVKAVRPRRKFSPAASPTVRFVRSFPKGWYNEVQVQTVLLSADGENDPDILSIIGASASL